MNDKKQIKKLTLEITDIAALKAAYPEVVKTETVTTEVVDRQLLRPIVKAMLAINKDVPGVLSYYANEQEDSTPPSSSSGLV